MVTFGPCWPCPRGVCPIHCPAHHPAGCEPQEVGGAASQTPTPGSVCSHPTQVCWVGRGCAGTPWSRPLATDHGGRGRPQTRPGPSARPAMSIPGGLCPGQRQGWTRRSQPQVSLVAEPVITGPTATKTSQGQLWAVLTSARQGPGHSWPVQAAPRGNARDSGAWQGRAQRNSRSGRGAGAAAKLKLIFPTVADSQPGCGHGAGWGRPPTTPAPPGSAAAGGPRAPARVPRLSQTQFPRGSRELTGGARPRRGLGRLRAGRPRHGTAGSPGLPGSARALGAGRARREEEEGRPRPPRPREARARSRGGGGHRGGPAPSRGRGHARCPVPRRGGGPRLDGLRGGTRAVTRWRFPIPRLPGGGPR